MQQPLQQQSRYAVVNWIKSQTTVPALIKTLFIFSLFSTGIYSITIPLFFVYGLFKLIQARNTMKEDVTKIATAAFTSFNEFWKSVGKGFSDILGYCKENSFSTGKFLLSFLIFSNTYAIISTIAIYGIYRLSYEEWQKIFYERLANYYDAAEGMAEGFEAKPFTFKDKLLGGIIFSFSVGVLILGYGGILDIFIGVSTLLAMGVGLTVLIEDGKYALKNFLQTLTQHPGKIAGVLWGRALAFRFFPGTIVGGMGPAYGDVASAGLFSGIFGPPNGWFTFHSGLLGTYTSSLATTLHNFIHSIFFSHFTQLNGHFTGIIGPSSFQIYFCILVGSYLGYQLEKIVDNMLQAGSDDVNQILEHTPTINALHALYAARYRIGITFLGALVSSALIVSSPGAAGLLAFTGGSTLGAAAIVMGGISSVFAALFGAKYALSIRSQRRGQAEVNVPAVVMPEEREGVDNIVILDAAPTLLPQFQQAVQQGGDQLQDRQPALELDPALVPVDDSSQRTGLNLS